MANQDLKLKVAELDFDAIKDNLKGYLKSQSEFVDYDFDGSGLSVLLDILAYNTHYMGYYLNMVSNEMFIDTALTRKSVVSHAKLLGYTPRSTISPRAFVNIEFTPVPNDANSSLIIPRFTRFISESKDGVNYIFVNPSSRIVTKNTQTGLFVVENLEIKEGQPLSLSFTYDSQTNPKQIFEIPESNIDTSTLQVRVQSSVQNANQETYILAQDSTASISTNSNVYYLEENKNGKYQIYFGDNVIGKKLSDGNIVIISYIISAGDNANGVKSFKLSDTILPGSTSNITTVSSATSGSGAETTEQIRFTAPKAYISQNRAVTKNDYIALLNRDYPYFEAVNVWGGEENVPPVYGKVFFTAKPLGGYEITETEIQFVKNSIIKPYSVLTVTPEYVAADYIYLNLWVDIDYDPTKTNKTTPEIETSVISAIKSFTINNLNSFSSNFKSSKLSRAIDDVDSSITNNAVKVILEKRIATDITKAVDYTIQYGCELKQGTTTDRITSTPSFGYVDSGGVIRNACYIEEVLQSFTGIESITIESGGGGYGSIPDVVIEGDGTGATATALIVNGAVKAITITNPGSGYTSATVSIRATSGGGSGAKVKPVLQGRNGILKIYYFDENGIKKTLKDNAGTIDYKTGTLVLKNFNPVAVADPFGTLILRAIPLKNSFISKRNQLVTLDTTDPTAIYVNVNPVI